MAQPVASRRTLFKGDRHSSIDCGNQRDGVSQIVFPRIREAQQQTIGLPSITLDQLFALIIKSGFTQRRARWLPVLSWIFGRERASRGGNRAHANATVDWVPKGDAEEGEISRGRWQPHVAQGAQCAPQWGRSIKSSTWGIETRDPNAVSKLPRTSFDSSTRAEAARAERSTTAGIFHRRSLGAKPLPVLLDP
jgi:hypothetical protein